ncbi:CoA transferase [Haloglomus irregulare]|jgi:formyl-CoA transferase|uniref:CoA transferase n=1 Tax=Haloglomus irregulare TaxID=2234134 RepID=A0A554N7F2_9EURY|nr:CoA transferase [Haloglomus irregulare]TSD13327.1 CoA transferase [Haloglomus irregulare]
MTDEDADESPTRPRQGPLNGLRVVDFSGMVAGGFATMTLADFGADVVAVEHPDSGDPIRDWGPFDPESGMSLWWKALGRGKRCVTCDLSTAEGRALALDLVETADVVVENFRPGTMERWNLSYEDLRAVNEAVVMVRISGYGQTGPRAAQPGFGTVAEAMSGFAHVNGFPDREPLLPPIPLADMAAGHYAVQAAMFALFEREVGPDGDGSGEGQVIDVSLYESLFRMFPGDVEAYDRLGEVRERRGNHHSNAAPRNVYEATDGYVALSASAQSIFENLAETVGHPELVEDERFATNDARVEHADELDAYIAPYIAERTVAEAVADLGAGDAVVAPVYDVSDVFADAQYAARDTLVSVTDEDVGEITTHGVVPRLTRTPGSVERLGPRRGQHNDTVYGDELGLETAVLADLREQGVI